MNYALPILALAANLSQAPAADPASRAEGEEPEEMIDFVGRRSQCRDYRPDEDGKQSFDSAFHWRRLSCAALAEEEAAFRAKYAGHEDVIAMLDDPRRSFRGDAILLTADGIAGAATRRVEQTGTDASGRHSYRLVADGTVLQGTRTRITAFLDGKEAGSVLLKNRLFERLDLQSLRVNYEVRAGRPHFEVTVNYGWPRDYCYQNDDAQPILAFFFAGKGEVSAFRVPFVNCSPNYEDLSPEQLIGEAPLPRRLDQGSLRRAGGETSLQP